MPAASAGIGLIGAIFLIMVVGLLTLAITRTVSMASTTGALETLSHRAFWAAESGAQLAVTRLFPAAGSAVCSAVSYDFTVLQANGCSATVSCTPTTIAGDDYYRVESRGRCAAGPGEMAERVVEVMAQP